MVEYAIKPGLMPGRFLVSLSLVGLLGLGVVMPCSVIAADDYMQALDAEAQGMAVDPASGKELKSTKQKASTNKQAPASADGGELTYQGLPASLGMNEFEAVLNQNFKGSYLLYKNLGDKGRLEVYEAYRNEADIEVVRDSISAAIKR